MGICPKFSRFSIVTPPLTKFELGPAHLQLVLLLLLFLLTFFCLMWLIFLSSVELLKIDLDWADTRLTWTNLYKDKHLIFLSAHESSMSFFLFVTDYTEVYPDMRDYLKSPWKINIPNAINPKGLSNISISYCN